MHEFVRHMPSGDCQIATYVQLLFQRPLSLFPHHSGIVGTVIGATGDKDQRLRSSSSDICTRGKTRAKQDE